MNIIYSENEKKHAQNIIEFLLLEKRFFIDNSFPNNFDSDVFVNALDKQDKLIDFYKETRTKAEADILKYESELGFSTPMVPKNRTIAQCNKYGGGFNLKSVFPLSFFITKDLILEDIVKEIFEEKKGDKTNDDFSPNTLKKMKLESGELAQKIFDEFSIVKKMKNFDDLIIILMYSKFYPSGGMKDDFTEGQLNGINKYPYLLGYLFNKKSTVFNVPYKNFIVFSTAREGHVRIQHWNCKHTSIQYNMDGGYDCQVHFATIF